MARFDVYKQPGVIGYILDCQADVLSDLNTRFVIPLLPPEYAPIAAARLNPRFKINGEVVTMMTQFSSSIPTRELGDKIDSLGAEQSAIMNAVDMLITGY